MTETDEILYEVKDPGIAWLTFNRPEARNAMTCTTGSGRFAGASTRTIR